ncbi:MAG: CopD family protein [Opitutae bacterium]|nr:CopD family protein [Opitutae bacterium]
MDYIILKALHIVGVVSWFAGLFYIVRLFIYHVEAHDEAEPKRGILLEQYALMERRLWRAITVPAMVFTAVTGVWLIHFFPLKDSPWLHLKLGLLVVLFAYHFHCGWIRTQLAAGARPFTSKQLRVYNEVATVLLVGIVFAVVSKTVSVGLWALGGCVAFLGIMVAFFLKKLQGRD